MILRSIRLQLHTIGYRQKPQITPMFKPPSPSPSGVFETNPGHRSIIKQRTAPSKLAGQLPTTNHQQLFKLLTFLCKPRFPVTHFPGVEEGSLSQDDRDPGDPWGEEAFSFFGGGC